MAERFRDLVRPSLVDVGARSTSSGGSARALETVNLFSNFSRGAAAVGGAFRAKAGAEEGAAAGATGEPSLRTGLRSLTSYGQAYNNAAVRSYAIRSEQDLQEQASRLEVEAGSNPETFQEAMQVLSEAAIEDAPAEAQAVITELYSKRTTEGLARINGLLATEIRAEDRLLVTEQIGALSDEIASLKAQDTEEAFIEAGFKQEQMAELIAAAAADNTISATEAKQATRTTERKIIFSTVMERFKNEIGSPYGDPVGFIQDLKEANRESDILPSEDEQKLENALLAELREQNALASMQESAQLSATAARLAEGDRIATVEMLAGELSQQDLLRKVQQQEITPALGRTLLNELQSQSVTTPKSDARELATVRLNLLSVSEDDILTNRSLTYADRSALVLKRREEEQGWKGTQRAKEAFARIDRALGLVPGQNVNLLSEEERQARDAALTRLYDVVDSLPPEERDQAILAEADNVIVTVIRENAKQQLAKQQEALDSLMRQDTSGFDDNQKKRYDDRILRMQNNVRELENKANSGSGK